MDNEIIANIKTLGIDMIDAANSGHPGIVLGAAPIMYTLFAKHLDISIRDSKWINRDHFVMSAGHGSALLYATLYMAGYDISLDDLKHFRQVGYKTPGHPEYGVTPGVDMSTGPLGEGFATAVGMAIASKKLRELTALPKKGSFEASHSFLENRVYVLCGDGDLMEGIASEAASLAGHLKLDNLIVLYDSNDVSLDGPTSLTFTEDVLDRFKAYGWDTIKVKNSEVKEIDKAISKAKSNDKPTIIEIKTKIGEGSFLEGTNKAHGKPLRKEDIEQLKNNLRVPQGSFYVNEQAKMDFQRQIAERTNEKYMEWANNYKLYDTGNLPIKHEVLDFVFGDEKKLYLDIDEFRFDDSLKEPTRVTNQTILNKIATKLPNFVGGAADTASATNTNLENSEVMNSESLKGNNICFGVRENAMGAILNGLALCNYRVFGGTFLSFSDYMRPSIRMSALMNLPVTYLFSHDSILIGEDGPTHQPIEQLASLRAIPNFYVYRPCDAYELVNTWNTILENKKPSAILLSRTDVSLLTTTKKGDVGSGGYVVWPENGKLDGIIIATGTEVHTAIYIAHNLKRKYDLNIRVVSMVCKELFEQQLPAYKEAILPKGYKKFVIEAGSKQGWEGYVYNNDYLFTVNEFGVSGPRDQVLEHMHFDYNTLENGIYNLLK